MKFKYKSLFYFISFAILFLLTVQISPLADDWYYNTAPNLNPKLNQLLPTRIFWRPFDVLFGFLMGIFPGLFPVLNRICVILSHVISVYFMKKILLCFNTKQWVINFCVLFTMFSSGTIATIASPDGLNQAFCLMFGLMGMHSYLNNSNKLKYVIFCIISILWKESGIVWIFVIPFLSIALTAHRLRDVFSDKDIRKRIIKSLVVAMIFVIIYFGIRFIMLGTVSLGVSSNDSRYSISLFSFSAIKNFVNIFANAMMGIDTIALFADSPDYALVIFTVFLSLVFLCFILYLLINALRTEKNIVSIVALVISAFVISLPHIAMGSAGEMHTYPTVFAVCMIYAYLLNRVSNINIKFLVCSVICIFVSFVVSGGHKLIAIYDYSDRVKEMTNEMIASYDERTDGLLIVSVDEKKGYSVFNQPAIYGTDYGSSMKPYFDWKPLNIEHKNVDNSDKANILIKDNYTDYNKIWIVHNDIIKVIK